jgi:hypothetical protein
MSSNLVMQNCHINADRGIYGNPMAGSGTAYNSRFFIEYGTGGSEAGWMCDWNTSGSNNLLWAQGPTSWPSMSWHYDGFTLVMFAPIYDKPLGCSIYFVVDILGGSSYYPYGEDLGYLIEDYSFWTYLYGTAGTAKWPDIPIEDEGFPITVANEVDYGEWISSGDYLTFRWTHQKYGLGADMSSGSAGSQSERTEPDWSYGAADYVFYYFTRGKGALPVDPRRDQVSYSQDMYFKYAWIVDDSTGEKYWIMPNLFKATLYNCTFNCAHYDVFIPNYSVVYADSRSFSQIKNKVGPVILLGTQGVPTFSGDEPELTYPGMFWYPVDPL